MSGRSRQALAALALLAGLGAATVALAQPPSGIVHAPGGAGQSQLRLGAGLFAANCASCHGPMGEGVERANNRGAGDIVAQGPSLRGVGELAPDFYLRTGRMPLERAGEEPERQRPFFNSREIGAITAYVASFGENPRQEAACAAGERRSKWGKDAGRPNSSAIWPTEDAATRSVRRRQTCAGILGVGSSGPKIPDPQPNFNALTEGLTLFTEHCAGCHQVVGEGGYVPGAKVPVLHHADATEIAEAVRIGPFLMPKFPRSQISDAELSKIVAYVLASRHPEDEGGLGIGHLGPVPEGIVAWLVAAFVLTGVCVLIGSRLKT